MVSFGGLTLPHVLTIKQQRAGLFLDIPLPGRPFPYRSDLGGKGQTFTIDGYNVSTDAVTKAQISALADGIARILDLQELILQPFDNVFYYQTTPAWTDDTNAAHMGGSPFTLLAATSDYMYFGYHEKFNLLQFIFSQFGNYSSVVWKYSQGGGAWNTLTITDGTSGLTQNGTITFTPPSDWKYDTINNVQNRFWVRVQAASVTTAAHINQVLMNPCYNCVLLDPLYTLDATVWDQTKYELTFQQIENP